MGKWQWLIGSLVIVHFVCQFVVNPDPTLCEYWGKQVLQAVGGTFAWITLWRIVTGRGIVSMDNPDRAIQKGLKKYGLHLANRELVTGLADDKLILRNFVMTSALAFFAQVVMLRPLRLSFFGPMPFFRASLGVCAWHFIGAVLVSVNVAFTMG